MKKILKIIGLVLLIAFAIAQFFGPEKNQGDISSVEFFLKDTNPPNEVTVLLKKACFDCHSNHTRYPWYNHITPVNYWLNDHIQHGKKHFNVSQWEEYSNKKRDHKLEELIEEVEEKHMPLPSYTWTHKDAILTPEEIKSIESWVKNARLKYALEKRPQ